MQNIAILFFEEKVLQILKTFWQAMQSPKKQENWAFFSIGAKIRSLQTDWSPV